MNLCQAVNRCTGLWLKRLRITIRFELTKGDIMIHAFLKQVLLGFSAALILTGLSASISLAQDSYEWDRYGIGFSVAEDMLIEENSDDAFTVVSPDGEIAVSISPWADGFVDEDSLAEAAISMAIDLYYIDDSEIDGDYIEIDSFNGYYVLAAPGTDEGPDFILLALLLDTESDTNIVAAIAFEDGNEYEAVDILESLYSY